MFHWSEPRGPCNGDAACAELDFGNLLERGIESGSRGANRHLRCAFGPGIRYGESFGVDTIGASRLEHLQAPLHRPLHGGGAGHSAADFVRELA